MRRFPLILCAFLLVAIIGCETDGPGNGTLPSDTTGAGYVAFAWNDLGMHCLNPTYDQAVILPPYNTVWAQVVKRGNPPQIVTSGITVSYSLVSNTYSYGKTDSYSGDFAQFWDNASLFGAAGLARDTGLNLKTPDVHNGLTGDMALYGGDHFEAVGVPVVPVDDAGSWSPYQTMDIVVKSSTGTVLASTSATVPTSDEINCAICHTTRDAADPMRDVLLTHDALSGTTLATSAPHLCAECHGSPVLGTSGAGSSGLYLSSAIHGFHADKGAGCYDCHPGAVTECSRSIAHTDAEGGCVSCHGSMANVAATVSTGRVPWETEPKCAYCHTSSSAATLETADWNATSTISGVDTSAVLYRDAIGHGGIFCASCHGSPHAMLPSREASDNAQAVAYQGAALTIGSCAVCHGTSRGAGSGEFLEEHGGSEHPSACGVCHTSFSTANTTSWPHAFTWKAR